MSKVLQNNQLAQNAPITVGTVSGPQGEQHPEQLPRGEEALIEWARATQRNGMHVTRDMLRRQAAILASVQWKLLRDAESTFENYDSVEKTDIAPVDSHSMPSPSVSLDWLDAGAITGATNTCSSSSTSSGEPHIPDLLSHCTASLAQDPEAGQLDTSGRGSSESPLTLCNMNNLSTTDLSSGPITSPPKSPWGSGTNVKTLNNLTATTPQSDFMGQHGCDPSTFHLTGSDDYPGSSLYPEGIVPGEASKDGSCSTDGVCLHEARRALSALENYLAGPSGPTALDQLCLNHMRARLGR